MEARCLHCAPPMIAEKLIECAKALGRKYPDQQRSISKLISAVERIDREFDGEQRIELLTEASQALQRHLERARATSETKKVLAQLRESHSSLEQSMKRLVEAAKAQRDAVVVKSAAELAVAWPRTPLPKKVTWH